MKTILLMAATAAALAVAFPSVAENPEFKRVDDHRSVAKDLSVTSSSSKSDELNRTDQTVRSPEQNQPPTQRTSSKAADLVAPGTALVLQPSTGHVTADNTLLAQNGSDVLAVTSENKPASNYVYVSVGAGIGFPGNLSATNQQPTSFGLSLADLSPQPTSLLSQPTTNTTMSQSNGFAGELAAGYQFDQARAELAVGYGNFGILGGTNSRSPQEYVIDSARVSPQLIPRTLYGPYPFLNAGTLEASGRNSYVSVLVNGYYDIATGSKWRPYIGAGVGYANVTVGDLKGNDGLTIPGGSGGAFAYQGKLGLSYEVIPKGNAFLEAAYLRTAGFTIRGAKYDPLSVPRVVLGWRQGF